MSPLAIEAPSSRARTSPSLLFARIRRTLRKPATQFSKRSFKCSVTTERKESLFIHLWHATEYLFFQEHITYSSNLMMIAVRALILLCCLCKERVKMDKNQLLLGNRMLRICSAIKFQIVTCISNVKVLSCSSFVLNTIHVWQKMSALSCVL